MMKSHWIPWRPRVRTIIDGLPTSRILLAVWLWPCIVNLMDHPSFGTFPANLVSIPHLPQALDLSRFLWSQFWLLHADKCLLGLAPRNLSLRNFLCWAGYVRRLGSMTPHRFFWLVPVSYRRPRVFKSSCLLVLQFLTLVAPIRLVTGAILTPTNGMLVEFVWSWMAQSAPSCAIFKIDLLCQKLTDLDV